MNAWARFVDSQGSWGWCAVVFALLGLLLVRSKRERGDAEFGPRWAWRFWAMLAVGAYEILVVWAPHYF